jgi:hypothetical protein
VANTYTTIQAAVTAATPGDIILVGAGAYHETVQVPSAKSGLVFLGAQDGVDARTGRGTPSNESVVSAALAGALNAGFIVQATNVIIDGFTIQNANDPANGNDSAIDLKGGATPANGAKILNNILQNNGQALSLNFEGAAPVQNVLVQHNAFRNNNVVSGDGIFTSGCQNVTITENSFSNDPTSAMGINNCSNVTITNNTSQNDGTFVIFTGTSNSSFSHNTGKHFAAVTGFTGSGGAAVAIGPGNSNLTISQNDLNGGVGAMNGIRVTTIFGATPVNQGLNVSFNSVQNMSLSGIVAEAGMMMNSFLLGNNSQSNGGDGIFVVTGNTGNLLTQNSAQDNNGFDCHDSSVGAGTLGTANTWFANTGNTSSPAGLCAAGNGNQGNQDQNDDNNGKGNGGIGNGKGNGEGGNDNNGDD